MRTRRTLVLEGAFLPLSSPVRLGRLGIKVAAGNNPKRGTDASAAARSGAGLACRPSFAPGTPEESLCFEKQAPDSAGKGEQ